MNKAKNLSLLGNTGYGIWVLGIYRKKVFLLAMRCTHSFFTLGLIVKDNRGKTEGIGKYNYYPEKRE
ncbi:hypothetical protein [Okeania sp. SIO2C2]|uniref:hypothetical protein n=1 Tax=Okeania sp. SIO2C2 TaxID=2607787 RepID=UPI002580641C|nr:hypothetical protein [Okeania sp. SIO2C2]